MAETVQQGARDPSLDVKMTDYAAVLTFASYGCDASLLGTSMSVERDEVSPGTEHMLLQLITTTAAAAEELAVQHRLTEDPDRAARLRVGTKLWSGWLTSESSSLPVRCVLYAQAQA